MKTKLVGYCFGKNNNTKAIIVHNTTRTYEWCWNSTMIAHTHTHTHTHTHACVRAHRAIIEYKLLCHCATDERAQFLTDSTKNRLSIIIH